MERPTDLLETCGGLPGLESLDPHRYEVVTLRPNDIGAHTLRANEAL